MHRSHVTAASGTAWKQGQLDFTGAQMVLTLKLISLASAYQDGLRPDEVSSYAIAILQHIGSILLLQQLCQHI